jgi:hypothetical protein
MPDYQRDGFVRVREGNWEYTIPEDRVSEGVTVVDKPTHAPSGDLLPPKPVTTLGTSAPGARRKRATKKAAAKKTASPDKASGGNDGQSVATTEGN